MPQLRNALRRLGIRNPLAGRRVPPVVFDRGVELGLGVALIAFGLRAATDVAATPTSVRDLGACLAIVFRVASFLGGAMSAYGILAGSTPAIGRTAGQARKRARYAARGRSIQCAGLWLITGAWAAYATALSLTVQSASATLIEVTLYALAAGCALRAIGLRRTEVAILETLKAVNVAARKDARDG